MQKFIIAVLALALAGVIGYLVSGSLSPGGGDRYGGSGNTSTTASAAVSTAPWVAAAPGRVEPKGGDVRIGTAIIGRVAEVYVAVNNEVEENELLIKLDDAEARARLAAAETQADVREKARDDSKPSSDRKDVRDAEDEVYRAERAVTGARFELDYAQSSRRSGGVNERTLDASRRRLREAEERLQRQRVKLAQSQAKTDLPAPSPAEAAVSEARAQVAVAEALLDKTRIRAPRAGRILQLRAKSGEMVAPSPGEPLIVIGDMGALQVKAEVDEADIAKISLDQQAFVKSVSYPGREFEGRVVKVAPSLAPPDIRQRGPRRPTDVEVLEVTIEMSGDVPLLPGMRVDAFFR
ncbi:MAG: efflux RND transporter periplasmic adaptor subunit [Hyphomicrobiaceae bacterium]|nr:efflux RND transporter periplasmic adaptor subunit [Hyphomicrobiaceae bacterium]